VRFVRDVTLVAGLDGLALQLLKRLAQTRNPRNIIVIEQDDSHPLLQEARLTGAHVITGNPASERLLRPIISGWRGCTLSYLYALRSDVEDNEAVLGATARILGRYQPHPERQPHIMARIDDPRHADSWRGVHSGTPNAWFEDALSPAELTACTLTGRIVQSGVRQVVLCGDSILTIAVLLELARRAWEQAELVKAAEIGRATTQAIPSGGQSPGPDPLPVERLILMDPRAADIQREYVASASRAVLECAPRIDSRPVRWRDSLLAALDSLAPPDARATAVIIVDRSPETSMHEAGRVARLHPDTPVFVQVASSEGTDKAIFDRLHPFQQGLLVDGDVPEDAWTRVARHWHECFRLRHPVAPGDPKTYGRRPWDELDQFIRQDNILQLRSILSAVAARGRQWVPARMVPSGSFIELTDGDLEDVARSEHTRWYHRRVAAGWSAGVVQGDAAITARRPPRSNASVVPWPELPAGKQAELREFLRAQLAQLEDVGYVAIVPAGGPPEAARFQRIGIVQATKLTAAQSWTRRSDEEAEELRGDAGDWRVRDSFGDVRTVGNAEFRQSHEPVDGKLWRRVGMFSAWRVDEALVIRTKEGRATANPGDWVVEGALGERWPISDEHFRRTYRPARPGPGIPESKRLRIVTSPRSGPALRL
jgi:Trk K+ transport system NAD-binding subunit